MRSIPDSIIYFTNSNATSIKDVSVVEESNKNIVSKKRRLRLNEEISLNVPLKIKLESFSWYDRKYSCIINDKYKYYRLDPILLIDCEIDKGMIKSPVIWFKDFRKLDLVNTESDKFKEIQRENNILSNPIKTGFIPGNLYRNKNGGRSLYIGSLYNNHYVISSYIDYYIDSIGLGHEQDFTRFIQKKKKLEFYEDLGSCGYTIKQIYDHCIKHPNTSTWRKKESDEGLEILRQLV